MEKYKVKILKLLKLIQPASNRVGYNRLDMLININSELEPLWGNELSAFLNLMEDDDLIVKKGNWYFSITDKGVEYLERNS